MNVCLALDSFKDCVTSIDINFKLSHILSTNSHLNLTVKPIADGGEGSLDTLIHFIQSKRINKAVHDPLGRLIEAHYLIDEASNQAYIELAIASGIERLKIDERNCWLTSAYGTGELIADAIRRGVSKVILFLGSSSTTEMGVSLASACGWQFMCGDQLIKDPKGKDLLVIDSIIPPNRKKWPKFVACTDVTNPLYGPNGAAFVYAKQKGASLNVIKELDIGLRHIANLVKQNLGIDLQYIAGGGSAGGIGAGAYAFFDAQICSGFDVIADASKLEHAVRDCDVVITGEGRFDEQSFNGKGVHRILMMAKKYNKRCIVICGSSEILDYKLKAFGDCIVYNLSAIFNHHEISKYKTFEQLIELREQIITSIIS